MDILINNFGWMGINLFLAILPVVFAYLAVKQSKYFLSFIFIIAWLLFVPNTIYLVTDLQYLPTQITSSVVIDLLLTLQYFVLIILGIVTYLYSMRPIVKLVEKRFKKINRRIFNLLIIIFNFGISFAVLLGKLQRTESWHVLVDPLRVIRDVNTTIHSPTILSIIILFGILVNLVYFAREIF